MWGIARMIESLDHLVDKDNTARFPILWSDAMIQAQRGVAHGEIAGHSPIDAPLAQAILLCVEGRFDKGIEIILDVLKTETSLIANDNESCISTIFALYVAQQFRLLARLLRDRFDFHPPLAFAAEAGGPGEARIRWEITPDRAHRFVFDACSFTYDKTRNDIISLYWSFPLYAAFASSSHHETGTVIINQADIGSTPGLALCENRPDYFLIPDYIFIPTGGYAHFREVLELNRVPWADRASIAFWRGATTGIPQVADDWRTLERTKLCEIARRHEVIGLFDVGFSSIVQMPRPEIVEEICGSGLMRTFVSWENWGRYKYLIDIDGNSSPWSNLIQRLLTGSTVLKVESSRGLQQWFYDRLRPWENYVPIAPDMSDLLEKVMWLRRRDDLAQSIGEAGRQLALSMTYEREIERGIHTIASCFRYFRGDAVGVGPYGRTIASE
jgi:hypothetical protein